MAISTNYSSYGQGYTAALYSNGASTAVTTGTGNAAKQSTLATTLREDVGVEVTLSPAALQALAQMATATTDDTEEAISARLRSILNEIFLDSTREATAADKALPKGTDAARRKFAQQATDFLAGTADNPFTNRSQADLAAIVVDPDGLYSINERRAAFVEFSRLDNERLHIELNFTTAEARAAADIELPKSNDPARVASALQATEFVNDRGPNPFAGRTRDELTAIVNNDVGDYTTNERLAALGARVTLEKSVRENLAATPADNVRRQADREMPDSSDPARLDRARQAMRYTYGLSPNPFARLTREELNAIVYDEAGTYTLNERRAAYAELSGTTPASAKAGQSLQTSIPGLTDQFDPYSTGGAYSALQMQQVLKAQNTSLLLGFLNKTAASPADSGQPGGGLLSNLFGI